MSLSRTLSAESNSLTVTGKHTISLPGLRLDYRLLLTRYARIYTWLLGESGADNGQISKESSTQLFYLYPLLRPPSTPVADDVRCACAGRVHLITSTCMRTLYICFLHLTRPVI